VKRELRISSQAEADITAVFDWYEARSEGLGVDFVRRVDIAIAMAQQSPRLFRKRVGEYRLAMTPRFPYAVYFIFDETSNIVSVRRVLRFSQNRDAHLPKT
jgi:plasmid stabilization system protein ParE